jgi:hypothetical protein
MQFHGSNFRINDQPLGIQRATWAGFLAFFVKMDHFQMALAVS